MAEKDTWERLEHLGNAIDLVEEFEKKISTSEERKGKEKVIESGEVSYKGSKQQRFCLDGIIGSLKMSIWRN